jgi:hypothetical protein
MKVGIILPIGETDGPSGSPTFQDVVAVAVAAEEGGLDSAILVAAKKPRMLRLTARWADAWNTAWYGRPSPVLEGRLADFGAAMAAAGRPLAEVARTVGITVRDPDQPPVPEPESNAIEGGIDALASVLDGYAGMGIDEVIVGLEPISVRSAERLAEAIRLMRAS